MQAYSDPTRESEEHALPDIEVFQACQICGEQTCSGSSMKGHVHRYGPTEHHYVDGWYWWSCFPGCLPDSEPFGPFDTEAEALEDARDF